MNAQPRSTPEHWDDVFASKEDAALGWWEDDPAPTLALLDLVPGWRGATIFLPGAGTSLLVELLLDAGACLVLNDISAEALERLRSRLGERAATATWLHHDMAKPLPLGVPPVDLWIDRAVLHFLTEERAIAGYFDNLRATLRPGGHALFAEFSTSGALYCAGLPVHRYDHDDLATRLGPGFTPLAQQDHTYTNPRGEPRPYLYALFRRDAPTDPREAATHG